MVKIGSVLDEMLLLLMLLLLLLLMLLLLLLFLWMLLSWGCDNKLCFYHIHPYLLLWIIFFVRRNKNCQKSNISYKDQFSMPTLRIQTTILKTFYFFHLVFQKKYKKYNRVKFSYKFLSINIKQAGAELCQAQGKLNLFWP